MYTPSVVGAVLVCCVVVGPAYSAPAKVTNFKICKKSEPKLKECVIEAIKVALPELGKGLPKYQVPGIDPLMLATLDIGKGNGPVSVDLKFKDLRITGLKQAIPKSITALDIENYKFASKFDIPGAINIQGQYSANGKVLVLPISGKGDCNITLIDPQIEIMLKGKGFTKGKDKHMQLQNVDFKIINIKKMKIKLENLFNGNKQLGDNMNVFLNENWQDILKELQPAIEEALELYLKEVVTRILNKVPYNDFFLN